VRRGCRVGQPYPAPPCQPHGERGGGRQAERPRIYLGYSWLYDLYLPTLSVSRMASAGGGRQAERPRIAPAQDAPQRQVIRLDAPVAPPTAAFARRREAAGAASAAPRVGNAPAPHA